MIAHLAAAAASCNAGSWARKWQCGWHQPPSAFATRAGWDFGHNVLPVLIMAAFVLLAVTARRRRKRIGDRTVQPAGKAWQRTVPARRSES